MTAFKLNEPLYVAILSAKKVIDWHQFMTQPKKKLQLQSTAYPTGEREVITEEVRKPFEWSKFLNVSKRNLLLKSSFEPIQRNNQRLQIEEIKTPVLA